MCIIFCGIYFLEGGTGCLAGSLVQLFREIFQLFHGAAEFGQNLSQTITICMNDGYPVILACEILDVQGYVLRGEILDMETLFRQADGCLASDGEVAFL